MSDLQDLLRYIEELLEYVENSDATELQRLTLAAGLIDLSDRLKEVEGSEIEE